MLGPGAGPGAAEEQGGTAAGMALWGGGAAAAVGLSSAVLVTPCPGVPSLSSGARAWAELGRLGHIPALPCPVCDSLKSLGLHVLCGSLVTWG